MKLYYLPPSPNSIKVLAAAHQAGVELEEHRLDGREGEHLKPWYAEIHPDARAPALVDGDFKLWESNAIMQYLATAKGESSLWPSDRRKQADISRWQCWQLAHWSSSLRPMVFENVVKKLRNMGPPDQAEIARGLKEAEPLIQMLDKHLKDRAFIAGDLVTLADFSVASPLMYEKAAGLPTAGAKHIQAWYGRVSALPAWQFALSKAPPLS